MLINPITSAPDINPEQGPNSQHLERTAHQAVQPHDHRAIRAARMALSVAAVPYSLHLELSELAQRGSVHVSDIEAKGIAVPRSNPGISVD